MYCRFCGNAVPADSLFCPKCGKPTGPVEHPRLDNIVRTFYLKTPYPYFGILLLLFVVWMFAPRGSREEYAHIRWKIEQDKKLDDPAQGLYQQALSLVMENTGSSPLRDVYVELSAHIEPEQKADVVADFLGQRLLIVQNGKPLPLQIVLADPVQPGAKRRYILEGAIQAKAPFKVTYELREPGIAAVLANFVVER